MKVREIVQATGGKLLSGRSDLAIDPASISTDTRTIKKGDLFIALKGDHFNADDFADEALRKGSAGVVVSRPPAHEVKGRVVIVVKDTTTALQDIAAYHRSKFMLPVIGVTGSNGKTTVKEMIYSVLSTRFNVLKNDGTKNNHIGVPQTLLKLNSHHDICVIEMGMNHEGEIRRLGRMSRPDVAVITNIGPSHIGLVGSMDKIFRAKKEILETLGRDDTAIINGDDKYLSRIRPGKHGLIRYGLSSENNVRAECVRSAKNKLLFTVNGEITFELNLLGVHNIYNALAAISVGSCFGISLESMKGALAAYKPASRRLDIKKVRGVAFIDDSYNSNPLSMECALKTLSSYQAGSKWVVSGDMRELGAFAKKMHERIGCQIARSGADGLITMGDMSVYTGRAARKYGMKADSLWHCSTHAEAASILRKSLKKNDVVLVKGSRSMVMEKVIESF